MITHVLNTTPRSTLLTLRILVSALREVRVVDLLERYRQHQRGTERSALVVAAPRVNAVGGVRILAHHAPHITQPVSGAEHPERALAEVCLHARGVAGERIRDGEEPRPPRESRLRRG